MNNVDIAFIGGSGLYKIPGFKHYKWTKIKSYFGNPSDSVCIGSLNGRKIAFLPRHGRNHTIPPSAINYRANIECLKKINCKNIISLSAVGSLRKDYKPGDFVIVDQFIDRTYKRESSFFDKNIVAHIPFAEPTSKNLRKISSKILKNLKFKYHKVGTYVCIEGPQFSTIAESELFRSWGCDVIGMTNIPEAKLAREAGICYCSIAMVTDYDCWHPDHDKVTVEQIVNTLKENSDKAFKFIDMITKLDRIDCEKSVTDTIKNSLITDLSKVNNSIKEKLKHILSN